MSLHFLQNRSFSTPLKVRSSRRPQRSAWPFPLSLVSCFLPARPLAACSLAFHLLSVPSTVYFFLGTHFAFFQEKLSKRSDPSIPFFTFSSSSWYSFQTKCIQVFVELNICEGKSERLPCFTLKWAPFDFKLYTEGNICRSPIAEAVFRKLVTDQSISDNWRIDSAATSTYELGNPPDYRGQACMKKHGIPMSHVARQVTKEDFATFDYILCMDESNLRDLNRKSNQVKNCRAKIELLGSYDPQKQLIIEDPYYGNEADFETVYQQCVRCCRAFLEKVR
uniref:Uncharacterized protein n=1 Tax=Ovis aries TaxID=9940 RepID=A0AC11D1B2_SHEEP